MLNLKMMMFMCLSVTVAFCEIDVKQTDNSSSSADTRVVSGGNGETERVYGRVLPPEETVGVVFHLTIEVPKAYPDIIDNGKYSVEGLNRFVLNVFGTSDSKRRLISKKVEQIVDTCVKKNNLKAQDNVLTAIIVICIVIEANKAGLVDDIAARPWFGLEV